MRWFAENRNSAQVKCPMTGQDLSTEGVCPNIALRRSIEEFCDKHGIRLPEVAAPALPPERGGFMRRRRDGGTNEQRVSVGFGLMPTLLGLATSDFRIVIQHNDVEEMNTSGGHRVVYIVATLLLLGIIFF